jgi:hypothetical protein
MPLLAFHFAFREQLPISSLTNFLQTFGTG